MAIDASIGPVPPLTAPASGSGRPSRRWLTGGILVRSVGNRPAQPALTYAPVTRLRPCCLFRATANTPETLSHAGAFARHRGQDKAARDAAHGQDPAIDASTGLVQAAPTQAPVRLTSPALAEARHFSLVSWPWPTPPAFQPANIKASSGLMQSAPAITNPPETLSRAGALAKQRPRPAKITLAPR